MIKIVFFGTPQYVIPILDNLNKVFKNSHESPIKAVVTQKPRPAGRKQELVYSAVDNWAYKKNVPKFYEPQDILKENINADLGVLASYGCIIPKNVLKCFPYGILVIHPSLLPQFRWSSPVPAAIVTNTNPTGVTIFKMDEKFDHGPIIAQFKEEILAEDTCETLRDRLFELSAPVLSSLIEPYIKGKIKLRAQDNSQASFARVINKEDAFIPPQLISKAINEKVASKEKLWEINFIKGCKLNPTPHNLHNFIRAMTPWPNAWTMIFTDEESKISKRLKIIKTSLAENKLKRGTYLVLEIVQLEGKSPVSWRQFKDGYPKSKFKD